MKPEELNAEELNTEKQEAEEPDLFLLTKPPGNPRAELCLKLAARSGNARLYLAGDGVYHLLAGTADLPGCQIFACKEDMEARGIMAEMTEITGIVGMGREKIGGEKVKVLENFYAALTEDLMENCRSAYTF